MDLGLWLAQSREDAGLTLDDVARATKLRASVIAAIEAGDLDPLGGIIYSRGHIRTIAEVIGVDPEVALEMLERSLGDTTER